MNGYIANIIDTFYGLHRTRKRMLFSKPKGMSIFIRPQYRGELYDRARISIKSKGRTGAAVRFHIMHHNRGNEIVLPSP